MYVRLPAWGLAETRSRDDCCGLRPSSMAVGAAPLRVSALVASLTLATSFTARMVPLQQQRRLPPSSVVARVSMVVAEAGSDVAADSNDSAMDELIRQEIEAAFAGLEESLADGDDEKAIALIQEQGKTVLGKVLARMEEEGSLLSASLSSQVEELAATQTTEMLKRYEEKIGGLQAEMANERMKLRSELENLQTLNKEYEELMAGGGGSGFSKDKLVQGAAFLVGLSGVGAAVNELLKLALGAGGDLGTLGANSILGLVGVGYYAYRKNK